jgi:hypothetical protein
MFGQITRIGDEEWPNSKGQIRCGVYEWRPAGTLHPDEFCIRFLSPEGEAPPRVFHIESSLWHCLIGENTRFLDSACAAGYRVLHLLGEHEPSSVYQVAQGLFRNRNAGHHRVKRQFTCAADLINFRPGHESSVLKPGFHNNVNRRPGKTNYIHDVAKELLRDALQGIDPSQPSIVGFREITSTYVRLADNERVQSTPNLPSWAVVEVVCLLSA